MKKIILLFGMALLAVLGFAQQDSVVNGVLQFSPHTFMVLPQNPQNPTANDWVRCWYVTNTPSYSTQDASWQQGINHPNANNATHRIVTTTSESVMEERDCFSCYTLNGSSYLRNFKYPQFWNSDTVSGGQIRHENQYVQLFYPYYGSGDGNNAQGQKIEYRFKVSEDRDVLLLNFSYVMQSPGHSWTENPYVDIRVLNEQGQNLNIGYYPNDYKTNGNLHAGIASYNNVNWPYSRFFVEAPAGSSYPQTPPNFQTPSTLSSAGQYCTVGLQTCPAVQIHSCEPGYPNYSDDYYDVKSYPYTIVAFNLKNYIGQTVVLRVVTMGCGMSAHFAYARFTAKMVPGELLVKYCGGDTLKLDMPWGFDANKYRWYNGPDSATVVQNKEQYLFDPGDASTAGVLEGSTIYHPILRPNPASPYYRCETESYTAVPFVYEATVNYYDLQPSFTVEPTALTDHPACDYSVVLHNTSKIGIIKPAAGGGLDTVWQDLQAHPDQCTWNFGDGTPDVTGFAPTHTYDAPGIYNISLHITDFERICTSFDTVIPVIIDEEFKNPQETTDEATTCENNLPFYYKPEIFGRENSQTRWDINAVGTRTVNYSTALVPVKAWNGCDSIVKVEFEVKTPVVGIVMGDEDFCDSAHTTLRAVAADISDAVTYAWTFMDSIIGNAEILDVYADGAYLVNVVDTLTKCYASASYTIDPCVPNVFLPNCITPSKSISQGPAQNDYFYLDQFVLRFISDIKFMVYARNGEQVCYYEGKKNAAGEFIPAPPYGDLPPEMDSRMVLWDGKCNGRVVSGTYTYALWVMSGGQSYLYKGKITVL